MVVTVLVVEVLGEGLASLGPPIGVVALLDEVLVALLAQSGELPPVQEAEGAGLLGKDVCELRAHVDLHALYGIKDHEAELPIEHVHVPDATERGTLPELVRTLFLVDVPVATQAIVAHVPKMVNKVVSVSNHTSVIHEEVSLLLKGEKGLSIFHGHGVL